MKRSFLATALILGMTSSAFAAANPFSDVPQGHWAYQAVTRLASEGIIEGYGDDTFRGNRNITRYEMAQMVAKALARYPQESSNTSTSNANTNTNTNQNAVVNPGSNTNTNISTRPTISGASRADLDRLAAEFRDELNELGVRVSELERNADMVKWNGKIEYAYDHIKNDDEKEYDHGMTFQLDPSAEVNDHWSANARFEASVDLRNDTTTNAELVRIWAEGDYDKFNVKLGKQELFTNEEGLIWDTEFSGAALTFGSNFTATLLAGRLADDAIDVRHRNKNTTDLLGANLQYELENGLRVGGGYYYLKDKDLKSTDYSYSGTDEKANIWSANLGFNIGENFGVVGSYAQNTKADLEKSSWQAQATYGNYDDEPEKGDWGVWAGYRRYGSNVSFAATEDDTLIGTRGWFVGAGYAPFKNVGVTARYFNGKTITDKIDAKHFLGKIEFFF